MGLLRTVHKGQLRVFPFIPMLNFHENVECPCDLARGLSPDIWKVLEAGNSS